MHAGLARGLGRLAQDAVDRAQEGHRFVEVEDAAIVLARQQPFGQGVGDARLEGLRQAGTGRQRRADEACRRDRVDINIANGHDWFSEGIRSDQSRRGACTPCRLACVSEGPGARLWLKRALFSDTKVTIRRCYLSVNTSHADISAISRCGGALGWSQMRLAETIGVVPLTIKRLENEALGASEETQQKAKQALEAAGVQWIGTAGVKLVRRRAKERTNQPHKPRQDVAGGRPDSGANPRKSSAIVG